MSYFSSRGLGDGDGDKPTTADTALMLEQARPAEGPFAFITNPIKALFGESPPITASSTPTIVQTASGPAVVMAKAPKKSSVLPLVAIGALGLGAAYMLFGRKSR